MSAWIGVDLDGTLAFHDHETWQGPEHVGTPIPLMVERVKQEFHMGHEIRIFTARVRTYFTIRECEALSNPIHQHDEARVIRAITSWCKEHLGCILAITNQKDYDMIEIWDDRVRQVIPNTGKFVGEN